MEGTGEAPIPFPYEINFWLRLRQYLTTPL